MHRIALPSTRIRDRYDVVVVGSGYGGGIAASRLSRAWRSAVRLGEKLQRLDINVSFTDRSAGNHVGVPQPQCTLCGDCVSGCNSGAKTTTAMSYLPDARNHGAEIFCELLVRRVEKDEHGFRVYYTPQNAGRESFGGPELFVTADVVVLGAGALGSTEILLRSAKRSPP